MFDRVLHTPLHSRDSRSEVFYEKGVSQNLQENTCARDSFQ